MTAYIFTVLGIVAFSIAVIALCWLFEDTHRARITCRCGSKYLTAWVLDAQHESDIRGHLTALCPCCRFTHDNQYRERQRPASLDHRGVLSS